LIVDIEGAELEIFPPRRSFARCSACGCGNTSVAIGESGARRCRELLSAAGLRFKKLPGLPKPGNEDEL